MFLYIIYLLIHSFISDLTFETQTYAIPTPLPPEPMAINITCISGVTKFHNVITGRD